MCSISYRVLASILIDNISERSHSLTLIPFGGVSFLQTEPKYGSAHHFNNRTVENYASQKAPIFKRLMDVSVIY